MECEHFEFNAFVDVQRITDGDGGPLKGFMADVRIACRYCGLSFSFPHLPAGLNGHGLTVSIDATELHVPITPGPQPLQAVCRYELTGSLAVTARES